MQRATTTDEIIRIASTQNRHILERQATPTALSHAVDTEVLEEGFSYGGDHVFELRDGSYPDLIVSDLWGPWLSLIPDVPVHDRLKLQYYRGLCTLDLYHLGVLSASSNDFYIHRSIQDYIDPRVQDCDIIFFDNIDRRYLTTHEGIPTLTPDRALAELCVPWMEPQWYEEALLCAVRDNFITDQRAEELRDDLFECHMT